MATLTDQGRALIQAEQDWERARTRDNPGAWQRGQRAVEGARGFPRTGNERDSRPRCRWAGQSRSTAAP
jgi:hypothetical protein